MSRIGIKPIEIPEGVTVFVQKEKVTVEGPHGKITQKIRPEIKVSVEEQKVKVSRLSQSKSAKALHGTVRALIANLITGVTQGFKKRLKLVGTGFRVKKEGDNLVLSVGFSHPVTIKPIEGIKFEAVGHNEIVVSGLDKALVGQVSASIRKIKEPDVYKGKGIRYQKELIKLKPGKAIKVGDEGAAPTKEGQK